MNNHPLTVGYVRVNTRYDEQATPIIADTVLEVNGSAVQFVIELLT